MDEQQKYEILQKAYTMAQEILLDAIRTIGETGDELALEYLNPTSGLPIS